jgi:hypothetical protein
MGKCRIGMRRLVLTTFLLFFLARPLSAQEMVVPVKLQIVLLLKTLNYDRNLKQRVNDGLVIAVCYEQGYERSVKVKDELLSVVKASSLDEFGEVPLRFVPIDVQRTPFADSLSVKKVDVLYVAPLHKVSIDTITTVSRTNKITTLTGIPDYVDLGLSVGIGLQEEKPKIIVNLPAAEAEGADFSSQLLKLAKIIQ